ncbi:hypothetical protein BDZ91DRAFT_324591 [Kalaharituber pfeilii]|nr:hypothetical protein BDZ91DRAFT_324591 [Kalaharituber pfeilii]
MLAKPPAARYTTHYSLNYPPASTVHSSIHCSLLPLLPTTDFRVFLPHLTFHYCLLLQPLLVTADFRVFHHTSHFITTSYYSRRWRLLVLYHTSHFITASYRSRYQRLLIFAFLPYLYFLPQPLLVTTDFRIFTVLHFSSPRPTVPAGDISFFTTPHISLQPLLATVHFFHHTSFFINFLPQPLPATADFRVFTIPLLATVTAAVDSCFSRFFTIPPLPTAAAAGDY